MRTKETIIEAVLKEAVSPPEWGKSIEKMKQHKEIDNPFAIGWSMYNKGYTPHYKETPKKKKRK